MENSMNLSQSKTLAVFDNAILTDSNTNLLESSGGVGDMNMQLGCGDYWPYYNTYHHYWPLPTYVTPNRTETAFKVVKVLIDKGLATIKTVKQFVETMDEIVKVL